MNVPTAIVDVEAVTGSTSIARSEDAGGYPASEGPHDAAGSRALRIIATWSGLAWLK
jgi:hypothetical protein